MMAGDRAVPRDLPQFGEEPAIPRMEKRVLNRDCASIAAMLSLALLMAGCSGSGIFGDSAATAPGSKPTTAPSTPGWLKSDLSGLFSGPSANEPEPVAGADPDIECPYIQIREGASTLSIRASGDSAALSVKYQGSFVRAARQCAVVAGQIDMTVGVEGRIILGPAGGPGQVDVPLRIAVVDQNPSSSKTIATRFIRIPVTVRSEDDSPIFTHVEDHLSFPLPSAAELDHYIVYIGFDPLAAEAQDRQEKPRPRRKRRSKPLAGTG